eukprot:1145333-Pelagomonas_calceolata.AAC.3
MMLSRKRRMQGVEGLNLSADVLTRSGVLMWCADAISDGVLTRPGDKMLTRSAVFMLCADAVSEGVLTRSGNKMLTRSGVLMRCADKIFCVRCIGMVAPVHSLVSPLLFSTRAYIGASLGFPTCSKYSNPSMLCSWVPTF